MGGGGERGSRGEGEADEGRAHGIRLMLWLLNCSSFVFVTLLRLASTDNIFRGHTTMTSYTLHLPPTQSWPFPCARPAAVDATSILAASTAISSALDVASASA